VSFRYVYFVSLTPCCELLLPLADFYDIKERVTFSKERLERMSIPIMILLSAAILLYILSFFQKDRTSIIEKELEDLTLNFHQETYQLKKRMDILEEELMGNGIDFGVTEPSPKAGVHEILKNQVIALYQQGLDFEQISRQSSLSLEEVKEVISEIHKS
jgi:hypothetical protein